MAGFQLGEQIFSARSGGRLKFEACIDLREGDFGSGHYGVTGVLNRPQYVARDGLTKCHATGQKHCKTNIKGMTSLAVRRSMRFTSQLS